LITRAEAEGGDAMTHDWDEIDYERHAGMRVVGYALLVCAALALGFVVGLLLVLL
jgi:hypothetical protein